MNVITKSVYDPLLDFCLPLHTSFPEMMTSFDRLKDVSKSLDWSIIREIGPGCSKQLLVAAIQKNEEEFFKDCATNPFLVFIGGKELYDRLVGEEEKTAYWGGNHLVNIIRQTMVLHSLYPMTHKLHGIIEKLTSSGSPLSQADIVNTLLTDPIMMTSMLSLMDSKDSMKTLMGSLKTIVDGMMTDETSVTAATTTTENEIEEEEEEEEEEEDDEKDSSALSNPSKFFRNQKKKRTHQNKKTPQNTLMNMMDNINMDDDELEEISNDFKTMKQEELSSLASDVTKILGKDPDAMSSMMNMLSSGNIDLSQMFSKKGNK